MKFHVTRYQLQIKLNTELQCFIIWAIRKLLVPTDTQYNYVCDIRIGAACRTKTIITEPCERFAHEPINQSIEYLLGYKIPTKLAPNVNFPS